MMFSAASLKNPAFLLTALLTGGSTILSSLTHQHYRLNYLTPNHHHYLLDFAVDLCIDMIYASATFFLIWVLIRFGKAFAQRRLQHQQSQQAQAQQQRKGKYWNLIIDIIIGGIFLLAVLLILWAVKTSTTSLLLLAIVLAFSMWLLGSRKKHIFLLVGSFPLIFAVFVGLRLFYEILDYGGHVGFMHLQRYQLVQKIQVFQQSNGWRRSETKSKIQKIQKRQYGQTEQYEQNESLADNQKAGGTWEFSPLSSEMRIQIQVDEEQLFFHAKPHLTYGYPNPGTPFFAISASHKDSLTAFPSLQAFLAEPHQSSPEALLEMVKKALNVRETSREISDVKISQQIKQQGWKLSRERLPLGDSEPQIATVDIEPIVVEFSDTLRKQNIRMQVFVDPLLSTALSENQQTWEVIFVTYQLDTYQDSLHPKLKRMLRKLVLTYDF